MDNSSIPVELKSIITMIRNNLGKIMLSDDDILFLLADEIARSFTRNENIVVPREPAL